MMKAALFSKGFLLLIQIVSIQCQTEPKCRVRDGSMNVAEFALHTCSQCHFYLFQSANTLVSHGPRLVERNGSLEVEPNIKNVTLRDKICSYLSADECARWTECCHSAIACCEWQIALPQESDMVSCPPTWDGYTCWGTTQRSATAYKDCPNFLRYSTPGVKSYKVCTENATWWRHPDNGKEYTVYTTCLDLETQKTAVAISTATYVASIALLIPAIIIFISYRSLLQQHRIRLHLNLFLAFVLNAFFMLLWYTLVVYNKLSVPLNQSVIYRNTVACRLLSTLTRYFGDACFVWMFCEGLFLQQLLCNTFKQQQSLLGYYIFGWGFALIPTTVYAIIQATAHDESCWMKNIGNLEWIHYAPNLLAIMLNFVFLCNILRILLTQLQAHPNEPSNYRRALKATFILVPLFGIQWFLTIYQPPYDAPGYRVVDIAHRVITGLQGLFVALIFCYFNGEVVCQLKRTFPTLSRQRSRDSDRKTSMSTQYSVDQSRTDTSPDWKNGTNVRLVKKNISTNQSSITELSRPNLSGRESYFEPLNTTPF